jgi:hypothetical protein
MRQCFILSGTCVEYRLNVDERTVDVEFVLKDLEQCHFLVTWTMSGSVN